jgi:hypothetical protein
MASPTRSSCPLLQFSLTYFYELCHPSPAARTCRSSVWTREFRPFEDLEGDPLKWLTRRALVAQRIRAQVYGTRCRGFESLPDTFQGAFWA